MKKNRFREIFLKDIPQIKYLTIFLIFACLDLHAQNNPNLVTIKKDIIGVEEAFSMIKAQTHVYIMYESQIIDRHLKLNLNLEKVTLQKALEVICSKTGLKYEIMDKHVLITKPGTTNKKKIEKKSIITGHVTGEDGEPLPGATIWIMGQPKGAIADADGNYTISATTGEALKYSFMGMEDVIKIVGNENKIDVILPTKLHLLQEVEVVSTGYQSLSKDRVTGSFSYITSDDLKKVESPNIVQRLEGQVPGLQMTLYGDKSFSYTNTMKTASSGTHTVGSTEYKISIRGISTLNGETFPLIVVDGVITEMDLSSLNPNDIDNISVLKDAAAASIWGVRAANGVIVITTKKGKQNTKPQVSFSTSLIVAGKPDINYLKTMTSAEMLDYEKSLVDQGIVTNVPATSYYTAQYVMPEGTQLALKLKQGLITQSAYEKKIAELSQIDNRSQISKYLFRPASSQQYNLSIRGGGNNSDYFYSASYSKENTNIKRKSGERLTLTLNNSWKLFNWATLSTSFKGTFFSYDNNGISLNSLYPSSGKVLMPYENLADKNGKGISYEQMSSEWTSTLSSAFKDWTYNYLDELRLMDNTQKDNNFSGSINLTVPLLWGLSSSTLLSVERTFSKSRAYNDPETYYVRNIINYYTYPTATTNSLGISNGGILQRNDTEQKNYLFRQQFNYDTVIKGIHRINALAGLEMRETNIGTSSFSLFGYNTQTGITNSQINYSTTPSYAWAGGDSPTSYITFYYGGYPTQLDKRRRFLSYYGNVAYTLFDRYSLSGSVRYDDYNNFGVSRKYRATPLYSFGAKWNLNREHFMQSIKWVNNLAVRLTYGINGNLSLDTYPFTNIYLTNNSTTGESSAGISALANPQLRWEKVYTSNFGVDFSLFGGKLSGSTDYYYKKGRDLLYGFPIGSAYVGNITTTMTRNAASIDSYGIDVSLKGTAYQNKDWQVNAGLQFSYNTNEVKDNKFFKPDTYSNYYSYYPAGIRMVEGYPTDKLLVYRNAGLDEEGLTQIYDENGNIIKASTTKITSFGVLKNAGRTTAPYNGSFNLNINYKQFSLYALATYRFGNVFLRPSITNYVSNTYNAHFDLAKDIAYRWKESGDELTTNVPKASSNMYSLNRYIYSDINVLKGDYIRMRQISLSYQFEKKLLSKIKIQSAQLSLAVNNLGLLWTANKQGYDPDYITSLSSTYNLPPARSYTLSLNVNF